MAGANDRNAIRLDPDGGLYSNISRLCDAHRTNMDIDGHVNQFWFRLYYSRPGTNLNADTKSNVRLNASLVAGKMIGKKVLDATRSRRPSVIRNQSARRRHDPLTRLHARRVLRFTTFLLRSSIHGSSEIPAAHNINPPTTANRPNPISRTHAPPTTASFRRAIPGNIDETRRPSFAAASQYVFVNATNCSRLMFEVAEREYTGDPAGCHVVSYCCVCPAP
ncbi:hypothetical protein [Burkholderia ambifaria]|uniref:hypothetical protein n=1 Tax=Burkholderia ambifaria TaxID=152480 RepID=UPI001FC86E75|nr:hypothetical protein [Burkholderia ambifaria]